MFYVREIGVPSSFSIMYAPQYMASITRQGSFQLGDSLPCSVGLETSARCSMRSPRQKAFDLTWKSWYWATLCRYATMRRQVLSLVSVSWSRLALNRIKLLSLSQCLIIMVRRPILIGITTSMLKTRLKGVLFVEVHGVVQYAPSTLGSSLAHLPLASSNLIRRPQRIV